LPEVNLLQAGAITDEKAVMARHEVKVLTYMHNKIRM